MKLQPALVYICVGVAFYAAVEFASRFAPPPPLAPNASVPMDRLSPQAQANLIAADKAGKELAQAKIAAKRAQFDVDEPTLLAKAKKLNAAGKYGQTVDLGNEYMWAGDEALNQEVSIARDKQVAIAMQVAKREAKKQGVRIGMSKQDVLDSSWGRPEHIKHHNNFEPD